MNVVKHVSERLLEKIKNNGGCRPEEHKEPYDIVQNLAAEIVCSHPNSKTLWTDHEAFVIYEGQPVHSVMLWGVKIICGDDPAKEGA